MGLEIIFGFILSVLIGIYLIISMIFPEKF